MEVNSSMGEGMDEFAARIKTTTPGAERLLSRALAALLKVPRSEIVITCIGTDRCIGDALGPLVGSFLTERMRIPRVYIYGTLSDPVHACNISEILDIIGKKHREAITIAVDSALGNPHDVGIITVHPEPLRPGSGVGKELPLIGDLSILGCVGEEYMNYVSLQNTRLHKVMEMAKVIASGVSRFLCENRGRQIQTTAQAVHVG